MNLESWSEKFSLLVCGETSDNMFEFKDVVNNIGTRIKKMTDIIIAYDWHNDKVGVDIPFYCRFVLESVMTALLGRFDPFRILIIYKVQSDPEYDLGKRAQSSIEWTGDIISRNAPKNKMWYYENRLDTYERSLLGNYYGEILWKPAFRKLIDYVSEKNVESQWLDEMVSLDEKQIFEREKSTAMRLFSSFSKGVHAECVIDTDLMMDDITIKQLAIDLFKMCSFLALASHFIDFCATKIDVDKAVEIFLETEGIISNEL